MPLTSFDADTLSQSTTTTPDQPIPSDHTIPAMPTPAQRGALSRHRPPLFHRRARRRLDTLFYFRDLADTLFRLRHPMQPSSPRRRRCGHCWYEQLLHSADTAHLPPCKARRPSRYTRAPPRTLASFLCPHDALRRRLLVWHLRRSHEGNAATDDGHSVPLRAAVGPGVATWPT